MSGIFGAAAKFMFGRTVGGTIDTTGSGGTTAGNMAAITTFTLA